MWARREFAWYLATSNLKARNATTSLGILWWVLNPLLLTMVFFLVFGVIIQQGRRGDPEYLAYLMSGMFGYRFTSSVIQRASNTIVNNSRLIVNMRFPRLLLPLSSVIEAAVGFLVSIVVFFAISGPSIGNWPTWNFLYFFPIFFFQIFFSLGLGALAARLAVPFRDVSNLIPYLLRMWLYLSPIIWSTENLENAPDWVAPLMNLNPMHHILNAYRAALLPAEFGFSSVHL
ncbi:MAG: ABC transporter permease, partial [Acidimicrobiia bacterium]|nr:ABC transporter permease [Acidimicrobiia bacterium]